MPSPLHPPHVLGRLDLGHGLVELAIVGRVRGGTAERHEAHTDEDAGVEDDHAPPPGDHRRTLPVSRICSRLISTSTACRAPGPPSAQLSISEGITFAPTPRL